MADRIVVLNAGRVEQFGTPMELYHHPASKFVAQFIGQPNMNLLPARVRTATSAGLSVELPGGSVMVLPVDTTNASEGDTVEVGIRPEDVSLGGSEIDLNVNVLERLGGESVTYGTVTGDHKFCAVLDGTAPVREGSTVSVGITPADCHVFDAQGRVLRRQSAPELVA